MRRILFGGLLGVLALPMPAIAQDGGWDGPRVLDMIAAARQRRAMPYEDSALRNYAADADGYIYFYLDRESDEELTLVKVDQVALEVYWAFPGSTRQRIVGLRDESVLPNRMRYHLDHLTVVQNEFGDRIELGDGDEVRSVVHPVAPGSEEVYHFRLADSLSLRLGGVQDPLRVYEVEVRPAEPAAPGFVGSVFLDASTSDIVRMDFTFTRASYVDDRLDYIRIKLENGLWQGRFWLPHEQRVELRRQLPELDFPAGAVIRGHMRVRNYQFNQPLPPTLFRGPTVTSVPRAAREAYAFEEELFAELAQEGLTADADLEALEEEAAELIGRRFLEGLPPLRVDLRGASSVLRFDRTERLHLGLGMSYRVGGGALVSRAGVGYSFGTEEPSARLGLDFGVRDWTIGMEGWWNQPRDLGYPAIAGVMNTFSSLAAEVGAEFGHDFHDIWFSRGAAVTIGHPDSIFGFRLALTGSMEAVRGAASLVDGFDADPDDELNRPLALVHDGADGRIELSLRRDAASESARGWDADVRITRGWFYLSEDEEGAEGGYGGAHIDWIGRSGAIDREWRAFARVRAGALFGDVPVQRYFLLGGRGTVPGYEFRSSAGDRSVLLQSELRHVVREPWLSGRVSVAAGWVTLDTDTDAGRIDDFLGPSFGLGIGVVNEILWLDLWTGFGSDGDWELLLSVDPRLWDIL